jgi:hypothetical protein
MSVTDWSPQPSGNAVADRAIPARDGMAGREVPEAIRGVMAKAAALALDQGGALVSTGTDNAYEVTTNSGFTDIKPGVSLSFWADRDNTGAPTLNVDGSGPRRWLSADGSPLPAGVIQGGLLYTVAWNAALPGTLPSWRMVGAAAGSAATGLTGFDFSGTLAERDLYDTQPKGKVFLAISDTPSGPSWTLYVKRSNAYGSWSTGLQIKASPAQSTARRAGGGRSGRPTARRRRRAGAGRSAGQGRRRGPGRRLSLRRQHLHRRGLAGRRIRCRGELPRVPRRRALLRHGHPGPALGWVQHLRFREPLRWRVSPYAFFAEITLRSPHTRVDQASRRSTPIRDASTSWMA